MTRETPGTTLEEELEDAAKNIDAEADSVDEPASLRRFAARLRLRAARVREIRERLERANGGLGSPVHDAEVVYFNVLAGPSLTPGTEKGD